MKGSTWRIVGSSAVIVVASALASASNLVSNGDFDTGTEDWLHFPDVMLDWDAFSDYAQQAGSGSAIISIDSSGYINSGATQCIENIVGGIPYDLSAWVHVPTGQSGSGAARVFVWWYVQPGCAGEYLTGPITDAVYPSDSWVERIAPRADAPDGATSALVYLNVAKQTAAGEYQASFDHVVLASDGIFSDGFESGDTSRWSEVQP